MLTKRNLEELPGVRPQGGEGDATWCGASGRAHDTGGHWKVWAVG